MCEGCVAGGDGGLCSHVFAVLLVLRFWISVSAASDTILKLSLREFAEKILENLRKKLRQKTTKNAVKSAELARNSRNYWQIIADLGQITFVASLESLFAYCANNLRTESWKALYCTTTA